VPKRVDHEERRRQIADALVRTAAARGLHATGMREVAAEAGVSLRLVQYYFGTKEELLLFAMQQLAAQFAERGLTRIRRIKDAGGLASPRDVIAAILTEALPVDDERRTFTVVYTAYLALSLTDPALAIDSLVRNSNAVIDVVAAQLRAAQAAGDTPVHLDPDLEAVSLLAMSAGLGTSVLGGQSSPGQAQAVIDYHLYRLFPASRPALRRALVKVPGWSQAGGQAERYEHRWLLKGRDIDQAAVFQAQHGDRERKERGLAGAAEVPGCARLPVGHDRQQPPLAEGVHATPERVAHVRPAVPFAHLGDGQPYVVAQQGDQRLRVGLFMSGDEALDQAALLGIGLGGRCPAQPPIGPLITQRRTGALECAVDRRDAHVEQLGDLGGRPADDIAQDQHRPLARRQQLNRRQKGKRDRLLAHRHRLRARLVGGHLVQQRVRVRLHPRHRGDRWPAASRCWAG
jgi:AcrR family transcriptional regulator